MTPVQALVVDIRRVRTRDPVAVYLAADVFAAVLGELHLAAPGGFDIPVYLVDEHGRGRMQLVAVQPMGGVA